MRTASATVDRDVEARLRISRDAGWGRYRILLDGESLGAISRGETIAQEITSGTHTLQLHYHLGLASPVETFSVRAGETSAFTCHPPSLVAAVPRLVAILLMRRGSWIALDRPIHLEEGDAGGSSEQRELIKQIQAAQANQPGLER